MAAIAFEVHCDCPKCAAPLPINALVPNLTCVACQSEVPNPLAAKLARREFFFEALEKLRQGTLDAEHPSLGLWEALKVVEADGLKGTAAWMDPTCPGCGAPLPLPAQLAEAARKGKLDCPKRCGQSMAVRWVPRDVVPPELEWVTHLVGEDVDQLPGGRPTVAAPVAARPVLFPCPACNASLPVDGSSRTVECSYCHSDAYLPDDLWRRLHPVRKIGRWYIWVRERSPEARALAAADRRSDWWIRAGLAFIAGGIGSCLVTGLAVRRGWSPFILALPLIIVGLACMVRGGTWFGRSRGGK